MNTNNKIEEKDHNKHCNSSGRKGSNIHRNYFSNKVYLF